MRDLDRPERHDDRDLVGDAAVEVSWRRKTFNAGTANQVAALVDIDLTVASGEFVSLIGPSGCGKSTLLRLIANLTEPTSGSIVVNGKPALQARIDQDYGMAFQQAGLFDWRTVARNVELPLELKGWDRARRRQRAMEMLELVKLDEFAGHRPWQLSGGMQQRVAIARALAAASAVAVDGRALRGARRDDPRAHAGGAAPHQCRGGHERRVRDPLDPRGRVPRRPRRRDVPPSRADHRHRRRRAWRHPQHRHARGPTVLQEDHRSARGAARDRGDDRGRTAHRGVARIDEHRSCQRRERQRARWRWGCAPPGERDR